MKILFVFFVCYPLSLLIGFAFFQDVPLKKWAEEYRDHYLDACMAQES